MKNRIAAFLTAAVFLAGQIAGAVVFAEDTQLTPAEDNVLIEETIDEASLDEDVIPTDEETSAQTFESKEYTIETVDAVYSLEDFEGDAVFEKSEGGNAEIVFTGEENGKVLRISGGAEVSYNVIGKSETTDLWYGDASSSFSGEGTEGSPYLITSGADLKLLANKVNGGETYEGKYFKLTKNIDLQNNTWVPIGDGSGKSFNGIFDGDGYFITNISIVGVNNGSATGFFGIVNSAGSLIKNLGIENVSITYENTSSSSISNAGGMIGTLYGKIKGCYAKNVTITNTSATVATGWVGGLVGRIRTKLNSTTDPVMSECYVVNFSHYTTVKSETSLVAPLIGQMHSSSDNILYVENCYAAGTYFSDSTYYYQTATGNQNSYTYAKNVYAGHEVSENAPATGKKVDLASAAGTRRVNVGALTKDKLKAALFDGCFEDDEAKTLNEGYPYHTGRSYIPDEADVCFDIDFETSDEVSFEIKNRSGEICVDEVLSNSFAEGWHKVSVKMSGGSYSIDVDGENVSGGNLLSDAGSSKVVFYGQDGNSYSVDNISIHKDFTAELTEFADMLIEEVKGGRSLDNVTGNLYFPNYYENTEIAWTSSDDKIIDEKGQIERKAVKLSAIVTAKFNAKTKASVQFPAAIMNFAVSVAATDGETDEKTVNDIAIYYLTESVLTDESLDSVTHDLTLPTEYEGAKITWETSDSSVITEEGTVILPPVDGEDAEATLTATITYNDAKKTTTFDVVVPAPLSDYSKVKLAANSIAYTDITDEDVNKITKDINPPRKGLYDTTIEWYSYAPDVIDNYGKVTRPETDTFVQLLATVSLNGTSFERIFSFNVFISEEAAAREDAGLISTIPDETTKSFELPTVGAKYESEITWSSSNSAIEIDGDYASVTRPLNEEGDKVVYLTASLKYGETTITEEFEVTVLKMPPTDEIIGSAASTITWESISPDDKEAVKNNLSLIKDLENDIKVEWTSQPAGYIDENGVVYRPDKGSEDIDVLLTAHVGVGIEGCEPQNIPFNITVIAFESDEEAIVKATDELSFSVLSQDTIDALVNNLYLPAEWRYGSAITWQSSNEAYIRVSAEEKTGYVTPPEVGSMNETVTLTANITLGSEVREKKFFITLSEPDSIKEVYNIDCEKYELGTFSNADNINVNKNAYVKTSVELSPTDAENKVFKITKNASSPEYAQRKGFKLATVGEKKGKFEFTGKFYFDELNDKSFGMIADFSTGEEMSVTFSKADDKISVSGQQFPMKEWLDIKLTFDTFEKVYSLYVNEQPIFTDKDFKYKKEKTNEISFSTFWFDFVYTGKLSGEHTVYFDDLKLIKHISSQDTLTEAATRFETEFLAVNDVRNITSDLILPEISLFETTVETVSSDESVITNDGKVTRPVKGDKEVSLTVLYQNKHGNTRTKVFNLVVKAGAADEEMGNSAILSNDINQAVNYIIDNHTVNYIIDDLSLLNDGLYGSDFSYISSDTSVISNKGEVTRPKNGDVEIAFTVKAEKDGESISRTINLLVKKAPSSGLNAGGGSTGGGSSSVPKGDVTEIIQNKNEESAPSAIFTDISSHWARAYIEEMYEEGIVNGKGNGEFKPDETVTREEFITMLVRTLGIDTTGANGSFTDVNENDWFAPFVNAAYRNNIVNGISSDRFGIGADISRQDMCVMVYNAIGEKLIKSVSGEAFTDDTAISDYAKNAVYLLRENGVINGRGENTFAPSGTATRAEAAKIIHTLKNAFAEEKR